MSIMWMADLSGDECKLGLGAADIVPGKDSDIDSHVPPVDLDI